MREAAVMAEQMVRADEVNIGDEVRLKGVWRRVTSLDREAGVLGFGRHSWEGAVDARLEVRRVES